MDVYRQYPPLDRMDVVQILANREHRWDYRSLYSCLVCCWRVVDIYKWKGMSVSIESIKAIVQCLYAIAGVLAIVGALNVYVVVNNDEKNVWKPIVRTIATTVILCGVAAALQGIYLN